MIIWGAGRIVTDGLVLHLDAANQKSYPGIGDVFYDISGNRNNGVLFNGPTFSSQNAGSIVLDGTNDVIYIDYSGNTSNQYTFNIVFNTIGMTTSTSDRKTIFGLQYNDNYTYRQLNFELWGSLTRSYRGNGGPGGEGVDFRGYLATSSTITPNSLNMITVLVDATSVSYYINGIFEATRATDPLYVADFNRIIIGARYGTSNIWGGNLYHFNVYDRLLNSGEVLQNFNSIKSRFNL